MQTTKYKTIFFKEELLIVAKLSKVFLAEAVILLCCDDIRERICHRNVNHKSQNRGAAAP